MSRDAQVRTAKNKARLTYTIASNSIDAPLEVNKIPRMNTLCHCHDS